MRIALQRYICETVCWVSSDSGGGLVVFVVEAGTAMLRCAWQYLL